MIEMTNDLAKEFINNGGVRLSQEPAYSECFEVRDNQKLATAEAMALATKVYVDNANPTLRR